ncbi:hypothetical protein SALBM217S_01926 [Streptomyces griseoloalbus]
MHRPAAFAALLGLTRAASKIGDFWVQNDFCARVKGASDDHPVTYEDPATKETTTHGTADGRKACLHHCLTYTATQAVVAGLGARALGIRVHPGAAAAALALSLGTHYIADRRVPGRRQPTGSAASPTRTGKTNRAYPWPHTEWEQAAFPPRQLLAPQLGDRRRAHRPRAQRPPPPPR